MRSSSDLLTTGQAARLLGCSRQHIVDLCERGVLDCVSAGTHRRVPRVEVEALSGRRSLTRDQERSLWLHRVVAGRLAVDPDEVLARASANLDRLQRAHPTRVASGELAEWRQILEAGVDAVSDVLVSRNPRAVELRQNSPFAGVLDEAERQAALAAFQDHWRTAHAA